MRTPPPDLILPDLSVISEVMNLHLYNLTTEGGGGVIHIGFFVPSAQTFHATLELILMTLV